MKELLLVVAGGALGAVARYQIGGWVLNLTPDWRFPAGTFAVNVLGCAVAGALWGLAEKYDLFSQEVRLFLFTGLLGGFTTFSAFGLETVALLRRGDLAVALTYVGLSVLCGVGVLWLAVLAVPRADPASP
jgi:CrcB protein